MYENEYVVDCCVFCSYPPPNRPPMRAKFRASSSFFSRNFVRTKLFMCLEFSSPANDVSNLTCFDIGYVGMAGSNLRLFRRFSGQSSAGRRFSRFPRLGVLFCDSESHGGIMAWWTDLASSSSASDLILTILASPWRRLKSSDLRKLHRRRPHAPQRTGREIGNGRDEHCMIGGDYKRKETVTLHT